MAENSNVEYFLQLFDEADTEKKGEIDKEKFTELYRKIEADKNKTPEEAGRIFDGIDINNNKLCSKEEFSAMVTAILSGEHTYIMKMIFRSFDTNRSRDLDKKEIINYKNFIGQEKTEEEIDEFIEKNGINGKLKYYQLVKFLKGIDIPENTDPYDGQLKTQKEEAKKREVPQKKSACCDLL
jgi:Ca2+-binding EF-hand superfamily protein